jgi:ATP-dependent helicase IRC3
MLYERAHNFPGEGLFFIAHRHELIDQAASKFRQYNPELTVGVERASDRACPDSDVVIGSLQSLTPGRLKKFDPNRFRIIVIDECHHTFQSSHYQTIMEYFGVHRSRATLSRQKLMVGFSATWRRGDGQGAEHLFDKIVFHRSILDIMRAGITVGDQWCPYLCPIRADRELTETNLDKVKVRTGDLATGELERAVNTPERNNAIVDAYLEKGEAMRAIAFTVDVQHSIDLAKCFSDRGIPFEPISGKTSPKERAALFRDFESGLLTGMASCGVLSEGTDLPWAAVGLNAKPTLSSVVYTQAFGRITRPFPAPEERLAAYQEGRQIPWVKPYGIWIDFTDSSTKHSLIQAPTLFGLRPDFAFKGKSMEETVKLIEEAKAKNPSLETRELRSLDDLTRSSVAFSSTAAPMEDAQLRKWSVYPWQIESPGQWALPVRGTNTVLRIKQDSEKEFGVYIYHLGAGNRRDQATTLRLALSAAEKRLDKRERKILQRDAPWRRDPPTPPQCVSLWMKSPDLRKQFRNGDAFFSFAHSEHAKGDLAFSKGSIADQLNVFLIANRFLGHSKGAKKQGWIAKATANVKARFN